MSVIETTEVRLTKDVKSIGNVDKEVNGEYWVEEKITKEKEKE